ncbi:uncharacterized protein TRAVEDRAFT_53090 [Trametes versicolor FP-101664 SS1]|uniref:uncharacterized protein n=1 Tax=Trametes versicolor (strain FP-101664) TaxID=717944 RepID=UPI0004623DDA|nr:uncharacterized protein TRAVEDRAFT_53090 [Trametes versicolor FP-101664 SS1]EIW52648.1 hypothetical protein TRAVEDRAFT_53090 [Trametes versicolor FP-101664 SS1]
MRVCRHWCALIRSSASFWRDIVISKDTKWFDLALGRLGGAPFRIELAPGCSLKAVLPVLKRHADQIEKLVFEGEVRNTDVPHLRSFLSRSFPLLNNLALTLKSSRHIRSVKSSVCSSSPLRWLDLTRTSLPWTSSLFTHLEVLSLTDCRSSTPALSFSNFLDALENGKRLRYLHLERFLSAVLDPQTSTPHERLITLPQLQHLTCCDLPANVGQLMTHLYTPAISRVELLGECHDVGAPSTAHGSLLPEDASKRIPVLRSITHASLNVTAQDNDLRCSRRSLEFEMSLVDPDSIEFWDEGPWVDRSLRQLPAMLGPALTELEVGGCLDVSQATWDRVFDAFPALQTLLIREYESVRFPTAMVQDPRLFTKEAWVLMVHSLAAPPLLSASHYSGSTSAGRSPPVSPRVRCPNLKILRIDGWDWSRRALAQILDCLRVRVAHGASKLEYLGIDAEGDGWVPELAPVLDKYRPRFLAVVCEFDIFRYWW